MAAVPDPLKVYPEKPVTLLVVHFHEQGEMGDPGIVHKNVQVIETVLYVMGVFSHLTLNCLTGLFDSILCLS